MGHQTRPAPRPPRPNRTGQTDDTASAGESPAAKNTLRARRAADLASCQPGLDADQISLYRHHQCLRALQRGTLRARQDFGGVPRTHQFLITLMVHTTKLKPAGHATDHIGKINDEWPPRDSHPERRSTATSEAKVRPTAGIDQFVPWSLALAPSVATNGAAAVSAALDSTAEVTGALGLANQVGPAYLAWNSVKSLSGSQPPAGSHQGTVNFTDMDQWMAGVSGLASSTGALGLTENAAAYDPDLAAHAGILQTNNQLGPAIFDLNVLKAIGFTQAPTGQVLNTGSTDNFAAVDIGRWNAGIPGVIMNSGTTGFVTSDNFGNDLSDYRVGGLQDTMTIGPAAFTFNFLPYVSTSVFPTAGLSFGNAQDMTAAPTPFAPVSPPTPGVIEPNGGLPVPSVVSSAQNAVASATPQPVAAITPQPVAATTQLAAAKPTTTIPGVNGAPLAKAATGAVQNGVSAATGAVQNGVSAATGAAANGISAATGAVANGFRAISGASASKSSGGK